MTQTKPQAPTLQSNSDKTLYTFSLNDFYNLYAKEYPNALTKEKYKKGIQRILELVTDECVYDLTPFYWTPLLGRFGIIKRRRSNAIDFPTTLKTGKITYFKNLHSSGSYFCWYWEKETSRCRFKHKRYYKLEPCPALKKKLSRYVRKCNKDPYTKNYTALSRLPAYEQS